ncbi:uncharacterized protein LOC121239162 [Juglans microcarpa x Juglans regia]|uniref:uncharacterized protein LOC121239162 n=1 Tax=Juglans microcarpa x Juglans regia TaxID=2249226 RepID=UPI001B7EF317|nr:uncharacterized protein LOC121239162 [Juglans microcarpa x Juglans regia]
MVGTKRQFLPLLFLSLSAFFFLFLCHSYFSSPSPNPYPDFIHSLQTHNINTNRGIINSQNFTFIIKVLAFNRLDSLSRCLRSLAAADYLSDRVHLHIYIDHFAPVDNDILGLEGSHRILSFVDAFEWLFGEKIVHYRTRNAGLQAQWLEAWWPSSDDEFAFVVEDDLEVSPLYYKFLMRLIMNFYYNASNFSPSIYGVSLQRPRFVPGKHGNKIQLDSRTRLFLYQIVGTWGQLLFPKPWKEFRLWYDKHKVKGIKPFLDGMVTTGWYKKMGERIWTPWFIKFIHSRGYFNIYTNFLREGALSVSHRDAGVNYGKTAGPDSKLLDGNSLDFSLLEMPTLRNLKWFDFCFREVRPGRIVGSIDELGPVLQAAQKQQTLIFLSLFGVSALVTRNFICHFERLNIWNYILVGPESDFLLDLARRGHPVINADKFFSNVREHKSMPSQYSKAELNKQILVKAYVIKKCLEYRYNSWMVDGNMLFFSSGLFLDFIDPTYDFYVGKSLELLYVKGSYSAEKFWVGNLLSKVEAMMNSRKVALSRDGVSFVYIAAKLLEQKGEKIMGFDETSFGIKIGTENVNQSSTRDGKKMVFWSSEIGLNIIQMRLQELGMWILDSDSSCRAVACHRL